MSDTLPEERSPEPVTTEVIASDLRSLGVEPGQTLLVHASLSALGWVCGGPPAVVDALQEVLGTDGTLVMATHSPGNMDPSDMGNPPVPESWCDTVREEMPPYRPALAPARATGAVAECFRSCPGVCRSAHPQHSFAAWGKHAGFVTAAHSLSGSLGEESPLARVYDLDGDILFLGTAHATNTSLHLAEYRADIDLGQETSATAMLVDGEREWVELEDLAIDDSDFPDCGAAFEEAHPEAVEAGTVGVGEAKRLSQTALIEFATGWFEANRGGVSGDSGR